MVEEFLFKVWTQSLDTKEKSISNLYRKEKNTIMFQIYFKEE